MTSHGEPKECLKKFVFATDNDEYEDDDQLEVVIPEVSWSSIHKRIARFPVQVHHSTFNVYLWLPQLMQPGYSFYTWPSATVLAWFLWVHRLNFIGKRMLEIGCGTGQFTRKTHKNRPQSRFISSSLTIWSCLVCRSSWHCCIEIRRQCHTQRLVHTAQHHEAHQSLLRSEQSSCWSWHKSNGPHLGHSPQIGVRYWTVGLHHRRRLLLRSNGVRRNSGDHFVFVERKARREIPVHISRTIGRLVHRTFTGQVELTVLQCVLARCRRLLSIGIGSVDEWPFDSIDGSDAVTVILERPRWFEYIFICSILSLSNGTQ